jgi:hypothetical protein
MKKQKAGSITASAMAAAQLRERETEREIWAACRRLEKTRREHIVKKLGQESKRVGLDPDMLASVYGDYLEFRAQCLHELRCDDERVSPEMEARLRNRIHELALEWVI